MLLMTPKSLSIRVLNTGKNITERKRLDGKSVQSDYMGTFHFLQ
jgi:hypothetical protein